MTDEQDKKDFVSNLEGNGGFKDHTESINRNGRPPKEESIVYWIKLFLAESEPGHKKKRIRELAEKMVTEAFQGNTKLMSEIIDRIDGKPTQRIDAKIESESKSIDIIANLLQSAYEADNQESNKTDSQ